MSTEVRPEAGASYELPEWREHEFAELDLRFGATNEVAEVPPEPEAGSHIPMPPGYGHEPSHAEVQESDEASAKLAEPNETISAATAPAIGELSLRSAASDAQESAEPVSELTESTTESAEPTSERIGSTPEFAEAADTPPEVTEQDEAAPPTDRTGGNIKPPIDRPPHDGSAEIPEPGEPNGDFEPPEEQEQRTWGHGQVLPALRDMVRQLEEAGVDIDPWLSPHQREMLPHLLREGEEAAPKRLADELGVKDYLISQVAGRIIRKLVASAPEGTLTEPEHQGFTWSEIEERRAPTVGGELNGLRNQFGMTVRTLATRAEVSEATIIRLLNGKAYPTPGVFRDVAIALGLSKEQVEGYFQRYRAERREVIGLKPRRQPSSESEEPSS